MTEPSRCILQGMQILSNRKWVAQQAVIIENGVIDAIIPENMTKHHLPADVHVFPDHYYLIPGLIDLHIHGAQGFDVMDHDDAALPTITQALAQEGITGFLATTMTASQKRIESALKRIARHMEDKSGAAIFGVHLEGPFIAKSKLGAQHGAHICAPDLELFKAWQDAARNAIRLVTLAPELPDAINFIKALRKLSVLVSIGHTNATYDETMAAIAAGCTHATHLFNAMRGIHQRDPGATGALLLSDEVKAELIVDGIHLHPGIIDLAWRAKGRERLLLVSDAMRAKCLGDGEYELGGQEVNVTEGKATLADGTLAGSTLRLPQAIKNMVTFAKCELADAIMLATENPARILGLQGKKGTVGVGMDADLVVLNENLTVMMTMREGNVIYRAPSVE